MRGEDEIPSADYSETLEPAPYNESAETEEEHEGVTLGMIIALALLIAAIVFGIFYGFYYFKNRQTIDLKKPIQNVEAPIKTAPTEGITVKKPADLPPIPPTKDPKKAMDAEKKAMEAKKEPTKKSNGLTITEPKIKHPDSVVNDFYKWYLAYSGNPLDGAYQKQEGVSDKLVQKINSTLTASKKNNYDPILCAHSKPKKFEIQPSKITGNSGSVVINEVFEKTVVPIKINVELKGNQWEMISITCLGENGARGTLEALKLITGLNYTTVSDMNMEWVLPDYKGRNVKTLKGKGLSTKNAPIEPQTITDYFEYNEFKVDRLNPNSYKKDKKVCLVNTKGNPSGKYDVDIRCAELIN